MPTGVPSFLSLKNRLRTRVPRLECGATTPLWMFDLSLNPKRRFGAALQSETRRSRYEYYP